MKIKYSELSEITLDEDDVEKAVVDFVVAKFPDLGKRGFTVDFRHDMEYRESEGRDVAEFRGALVSIKKEKPNV